MLLQSPIGSERHSLALPFAHVIVVVPKTQRYVWENSVWKSIDGEINDFQAQQSSSNAQKQYQCEGQHDILG
jgi:hypothetical protein